MVESVEELQRKIGAQTGLVQECRERAEANPADDVAAATLSSAEDELRAMRERLVAAKERAGS